MREKGFIFDYAKCVGCHACIVACKNENHTVSPLSWRGVNAFNPKKIPLSGFLYLSLACNHCNEAPCLKACPANAYSKDRITGAIIHNPKRCIGCQYCTWVCPFDAPKFNPNTCIIEKCNLCNHLLVDGKTPACANNCPTGALGFGEIDINSNVDAAGFSSQKIFPRIKVNRPEIISSIPEMDIELNLINDNYKYKPKISSKIIAVKEWPLILFTVIASVLSGWFSALSMNNEVSYNPIFYLSLGLFGIILSAFHLGKPFRAINSLFNLKTSWLSREILFFMLFLICSLTYLQIYKNEIFFYISLLFSILMLLSIDKVYIAFSKNNIIYHSAGAVITAILFTFVFNYQVNFIIAILSLKAVLYIMQKNKQVRSKNKPLLSFLRVLLGFIFPFAIILFLNLAEYVFPFIIIGEIIDRYEFYDSLNVETPQSNLLKIESEYKSV